MSSRKDSKGRVLKQGESQRNNGSYMYRYTDIFGKRQTVYAKTLNELRDKEKQIANDLSKGMDYVAGNITVSELLDKYLKLKNDIRASSMTQYEHWCKVIRQSYLGEVQIRNIKPSTAKEFFIHMNNTGWEYSSLQMMKHMLTGAFNVAIDDGIATTNPFRIKMPIVNSERKREALTDDEVAILLNFVSTDRVCNKYYDIVYVLLNTGLRAGELCGLTKNDIDMSRKIITVNKQVTSPRGKSCIVGPPKTGAGYRSVPIINGVDEIISDTIARREYEIQPSLDGVSGFLFLSERGEVASAKTLAEYFSRIRSRLKSELGIEMKVSAHVLRHTYCTNLIRCGVNVKTVQYIMGHSSSAITMDVYAHVNQDVAIHEVQNLHLIP